MMNIAKKVFSSARTSLPAIALCGLSMSLGACLAMGDDPASQGEMTDGDEAWIDDGGLSTSESALVGTNPDWECRMQGDVPARRAGEVSNWAQWWTGCRGDYPNKNAWHIINLSSYTGDVKICADDDRQTIPSGWTPVGNIVGAAGGGCNKTMTIRKDPATPPAGSPSCKYMRMNVRLLDNPTNVYDFYRTDWGETALFTKCEYKYDFKVPPTAYNQTHTIRLRAITAANWATKTWSDVMDYETKPGQSGTFRVRSKSGSFPTIACVANCVIATKPPAPTYCPYNKVDVTQELVGTWPAHSQSSTQTLNVPAGAGGCADHQIVTNPYYTTGTTTGSYRVSVRYYSTLYFVPDQSYAKTTLNSLGSSTLHVTNSGFAYDPATAVLAPGSVWAF